MLLQFACQQSVSDGDRVLQFSERLVRKELRRRHISVFLDLDSDNRVKVRIRFRLSYPHPGVNVHQSSPGDRLHDAIVVSDHLLELCIAVAIGGAEHQRAHDVGDGPGHRRRRVEAESPTGQQLSTKTVHRGQNWRKRNDRG